MREDHDPSFRQLPGRLRAVGPGWHRLLEDLHEQLHAMHPRYEVGDLKEKLGGVRIKITGVSDAARSQVQALVIAAEVRSASVCEFCGAPARCRRRNDAASGWIKAVCDSCHAAWSRHEIMIVRGDVHHRPRGGM
ncbi:MULTISPECIES: hypothetical protein [unclassified Streptomyces]|uniref:hypothetical protein n=1 Tax=unclassified Streptomyces TaxID=2593676 RepID=UPI002E185BAB|nr:MULTISPECIES: hypothetical protein [unclassified Streptomyces]